MFLCPALIYAGFLDGVLNQAQKAVEDTYEKTVESATNSKKKTSNPVNQVPKPDIQSVGKDYIRIADVPNGRRPATPVTLGLARLRYDQSWLTESNLLKLTQAAVRCQQERLKGMLTKSPGCIGEILDIRPRGKVLRIVPVFSDGEIEGRNPQFAAQGLQGKMKHAVMELAAHLPPKFGNTIVWYGQYDFNKGELVISIRQFEQAPNYYKNKAPQNVRHLDLYKAQNRNHGGVVDEFHLLKAYLPSVGGIDILAFDRRIREGRMAMSATEAETLFKGASKNQVNGFAAVEFTMEGVAGNTALARLEKVQLLTIGIGDVDFSKVKPIMTVPASAFPKLEPAKKQAKASINPPKSAPVSAQAAKQSPAKAQTKSSPTSAGVDPFLRARQSTVFGPDVVGLQLGITLDAADKLIRERKKPREVINGKPPSPFSQARLYVLEPGDEAIALFTLKSQEGERVATLTRTVYFDPNAAPSQTAVGASVEKKYGSPAYKYEVKSRFDRMWLTDWKGEKITSSSSNTRACEYALSGSAAGDTWRVNNQPYNWELPWPERAWVGPGRVPSPGNHPSMDKVNHCGPTLRAKYSENSGMLTGPSLHVIVYDGAWVIAASKARDEKDAAQGAKGLDL